MAIAKRYAAIITWSSRADSLATHTVAVFRNRPVARQSYFRPFSGRVKLKNPEREGYFPPRLEYPSALELPVFVQPLQELHLNTGVVHLVDDLEVEQVGFEVRIAVAMTWLSAIFVLLFVFHGFSFVFILLSPLLRGSNCLRRLNFPLFFEAQNSQNGRQGWFRASLDETNRCPPNSPGPATPSGVNP